MITLRLPPCPSVTAATPYPPGHFAAKPSTPSDETFEPEPTIERDELPTSPPPPPPRRQKSATEKLDELPDGQVP